MSPPPLPLVLNKYARHAASAVVLLLALERWRRLLFVPSLESMAGNGKEMQALLPPGKQVVFFPLARRQLDSQPEARKLYDLGSASVLLHQRAFDMSGDRGSVEENSRAYLEVELHGTRGDGAKRYGKAAETFAKENMKVGHYYYPPTLVPLLPVDDARWRFSTCAVVGNSGKLLYGRGPPVDGMGGNAQRRRLKAGVELLGREIDSHRAVFRINGAPTRGFERYVGSRTTFDVSNHLNLHRLSLKSGRRGWVRSRGARMVVFESTHYQQYFHAWERIVARFPKQLLILAPDLVAAHYELWCRLVARVLPNDPSPENGKPTSGWFATAMAAQVCDKVTLYGFDAWDSPTDVKGKERRKKRARDDAATDRQSLDWADDAGGDAESASVAGAATAHDIIMSSAGDDRNMFPYHYFDKDTGQTSIHSFPLLVRVFHAVVRDGFPLAFV